MRLASSRSPSTQYDESSYESSYCHRHVGASVLLAALTCPSRFQLPAGRRAGNAPPPTQNSAVRLSEKI